MKVLVITMLQQVMRSYDETLLLTMESALNKSGIEHIRTKTWTTDAFYRETAAKVNEDLQQERKL